MPDLFLRHNFATTTTINTLLCVTHSARHAQYTHHPNAWSWQPRISRYSLGNTRHLDGHKNPENVRIMVHAISLQRRRLSTRCFVCRTLQGTHYTHIIQTHGHDSQEFRDIHLVTLVTLKDTKFSKMWSLWFSPFPCNHDDFRHATLCAALYKAHIIHTSSKRRVMTVKNFEWFSW